MKDNEDIYRGKGYGFFVKAKNMIYMMRCFVCGKENYMGAVSSGKCAWCGYDANA